MPLALVVALVMDSSVHSAGTAEKGTGQTQVRERSISRSTCGFQA
jgi:hypothetical protein